jgi:hypothetical protein
MEVLAHGPERAPRRGLRRVLLAATVTVGLAVALHPHSHPPAAASPSVPPTDPVAAAAAATLQQTVGTQAIQALTVRGLANVGPVRITPAEYVVDLVCAAPAGSLLVQLRSGEASVDATVDCSSTPTPATTAIETDPDGLSISVVADSTAPAGFAYLATKSTVDLRWKKIPTG